MKIDPFHCLRFSLISLKLKQSVSCIRQSERVIKNRPWIRDVQTRIKAQKKYYSIEIFPNLRFPLKFCLNRLPINSLSEERRIYCPILVVKMPSLSRSQGQWFGLCLVLGTLVFGPRNNWSMGKPAQVWTIRETRNWIIGLNYSSIMRTVDNDVLIHRD